ncbi:MAG: hypothetical protein JSV36_07290 [Anaerolineae bacterium]|nr:MAG: hypothetical protein JSV36_07290 [Anaerolineae bacterium]
MLFPTNHFLIAQMVDMRLEEELRRAETRRLLHEAGIGGRGWLSRESRWLLCQIGRLLVAVGQRLERYTQPRVLPVE